jgi:uncharacterized membrane protein
MTIEPLIQASFPIKIHVTSVMVAIVLTPIQLSLKRGGDAHRLIGKIWIAAMVVVALSSFFISTIRWIGPFSPLHLLSIMALISIAVAYGAARRGHWKAHAWTMISMVVSALIVTGLFTLLLGRIMNNVLFGN